MEIARVTWEMQGGKRGKMNRLEENELLRERFKKLAEEHPQGSYPVMVSLYLGQIVMSLEDISKSLAILAHEYEDEEPGTES
jgi:hypothetical protein